MKVIDNKKYFELAELKKMLKQKSWKDSWNVETIYINNFIEFLEKIEIIEEDIEEDKPIEKITIDLNYANHYSKANVKANGKYLAEKINEIIDVVNELKERE